MQTKELLNKLLYDRLIIIRTFYNVSQKSVAEFLNVSIQTYMKWENGKSAPDIMMLKILISDFFRIPLDAFFNKHISTDVLLSSCLSNLKPPEKNMSNYHTPLQSKVMVKERLPLLRELKGLSVKSMADKLNVDTSEYLKWEKGRALPDAMMLKIIVVDILNYSLDEFLNVSLPISEMHPLQINVMEREKALKLLVSEKLPKLRENAKLTQQDMAKYLGVDKNLYIDWEKGYKLIDVLSLKKIVVDLFHITLEEFLDNSKSLNRLMLTAWGETLQPFLLDPQEQSIIMLYRRN